MEKNRSHGKIDNLPEYLRKEVEEKLLTGYTYEEIANFLKGMGHDIHFTSVHRFGKPFLKKFESVRMAKEFAQLLSEDNAMRPTTELHEANNALISQMVMEALVDEGVSKEEKLKAAKSIASLQHAQVANERLKVIARKEAGAVKTAMNMLRERMFKEIQSSYPEIMELLLQIAEEVEKEVQSI